MRIVKLLIAATLALLLSQCSSMKGWFGMGDNNYQQEDQYMTPINVPGDLSNSRIHNQYPVSGGYQSGRSYNSGGYRPVTKAPEPKEVVPQGSMLERYQQQRQGDAGSNPPSTNQYSPSSTPAEQPMMPAKPVG